MSLTWYFLQKKIRKSEEKIPLLIEMIGKTKIHVKKYLINDPLDLIAGNVKWVRPKRMLKKGLKFVAPTISGRLKAALEI